jgi:hypothetical protein
MLQLPEIQAKIFASALAAESFEDKITSAIIASLKKQTEVNAIAIAKTFGNSKLIRQFNLCRASKTIEVNLEFDRNLVNFNGQNIGKTKTLYKSPLPGELQARLAVESAIDRFLEYLQQLYKIVVLNESDRHALIFIPNNFTLDFNKAWQDFLKQVAFAEYDDSRYQLPALVQTFILMLKSVTLAGRGFSTLDVPILTRDQANVLAAWYYAVVRDVRDRQIKRQQQIDRLTQELETSDLSEKDRKSKEKELQDKQSMQDKEAKKYQENFQKSFVKSLEEQEVTWQELNLLETQLSDTGLTKAEQKKLEKQQEKLSQKLTFDRDFIRQRLALRKDADNPFTFVERDTNRHPEYFAKIAKIAKSFDKTATDQINSTRGDIFTQCLTEMYRLLEMQESEFEKLPAPLLTEQPPPLEVRSPGDDSKEFCYSCGVTLDSKTARWQVLRFMFERPSQRRQSASGEGRPHICSSCAALAFASPLKVTDESIILRLEPLYAKESDRVNIQNYLRMFTNGELHLSAGRYLILTSDRTIDGNLASQKLGQVQFAYAKVASIFPVEVLNDFRFFLIPQGSQAIDLQNRHLIFIKGLMQNYGQSIAIAGKEINMTLGDGIRYIQQDLPYLAEYAIVKVSNVSNQMDNIREMEQIRKKYLKIIRQDLVSTGESMESNKQLPKRARLYRDVSALTGLTYAFTQSLEITARKLMKPEDAEREVSKLIEKVDDPVAFGYYATLGDENKTSVQARLYHVSDTEFIYEQTKDLLNFIQILDRENKDDRGKKYLQFYADDITRVYAHFSQQKEYAQEKDWKELTYNLQLSLYTRFPELVRKLKSNKEK